MGQNSPFRGPGGLDPRIRPFWEMPRTVGGADLMATLVYLSQDTSPGYLEAPSLVPATGAEYPTSREAIFMATLV